MTNKKVMVIDDSALIRALFCDVLDNAKGIEVCGVAANADEAREKIGTLKPDVLTLDNEMPGMSGLDFLEEIMEERPMPVIMLSSLTQTGTGTEQRAFELGAAHCFAKPISSSRDQFNATVAELADIVRRVANGQTPLASGESGDAEGAASGTAEGGCESAAASYTSDGSIVVLVCGAAGMGIAKQVLASYPQRCPPTILMLDADRAEAERIIDSVQSSVVCSIEMAKDGLELKPGSAVVVHSQTGRVLVEAGQPDQDPRLRLASEAGYSDIDPASWADSLLTSLAQRRIPALGGILTGKEPDGAEGLKDLVNTGSKAFVQRPPDYAPRDSFDAVRELGLDIPEIKHDAVPDWILENTDDS